MADENDPSAQRPPGSGPRAAASSGPAPAHRYSEGELIAEKYRLGKRLGEGGMGEVWLAHNETLDIDVAIKLIRSDESSSESDRTDRLLHEARAAARLGHPSIVRVNDFGKTHRGDPFIVMELLSGEDLGEALSRRGRLSATKAVRTILPIVNALTVAHTKGIVHRDLKPENIFLAQGEDGQIVPKLVDFGVAKLEVQASIRVTQTGALMGSPLYMSPEQARGDDVDHRADIWAMSVVLYEMITGRPPFEGKNYNAVVYSIIANPPTPITGLGVGDEELWTILERGFQKDPDRRWYSMRDFGEALAMWLEEHGVHDDITGASLQTAWLGWQKEQEDVSTVPPPGPDDAGAGATSDEHPTGDVVLPPPAIPARTREITVRTRRSSAPPSRTTYVLLALMAALAVVVALVVALRREEVVEVSPAPNPGAESDEATEGRIVITDEPGDDPVVVEQETTLSEPAIAPSTLPRANDETKEPKRAAKSSKAPSASASSASPPEPPPPRAPIQKKAGSREIVTQDPYSGPDKKELKNPFE